MHVAASTISETSDLKGFTAILVARDRHRRTLAFRQVKQARRERVGPS